MRDYYGRHVTGFSTLVTAPNASAAHRAIKRQLQDADMSTDVNDWKFTRVDTLFVDENIPSAEHVW